MQKLGVYIGTAGWSYNDWKSCFYPQQLAPLNYLRFYTSYFSCVEVNSTFYRIPEKSTLIHWKKATRNHFVFTIKVSRYITHQKKLHNCARSLQKFLKRIETLGDKCGPFLFQLPATFKKNSARLEQLLTLLPKHIQAVFEFRDESWHDPEIYALCKRYLAALCIHDFNGRLSLPEITAPFVYIRLHGPRQAYRGAYTVRQLQTWARRIEQWHANKLTVYCFFNNDQKGYAVRNALELKKIISSDNL